MSTKITINAARGSTTYLCEIIEETQQAAEEKAASFEKWMNEQPARFQFNDTQQRSIS